MIDAPRSAPFDDIAPNYDSVFTHTHLGQLLRQRVWSALGETFHVGQHVLELGCGTGEDAVWLARRGISVVATDASAEMLRIAHAKANAARLDCSIRFAMLDANRPSADTDIFDDEYDGAFADFGALNCVEDRPKLARRLAQVLRGGARFLTVVMGPLCAWEIVWHLLHLDPRGATRRWRDGVLASVGGAQVPVWYPSPRRLRAEFSPWFAPKRCQALGALLPPPHVSGIVERWPGLFHLLARLDAWTPFGAWWAGHYLMVLERRT